MEYLGVYIYCVFVVATWKYIFIVCLLLLPGSTYLLCVCFVFIYSSLHLILEIKLLCLYREGETKEDADQMLERC
jgi:hypothetical protein